MTNKPAVEYDKFMSLDGLALCEYMEPFVLDPTTSVASEVLDRMLTELPAYDEYHTVYALQLGCDHAPDRFVPQLPHYLAHREGSVWSTAYRILGRLPDEYVTQDLVAAVRRVYSSCPERNWIEEMLQQLEDRLWKKGD